MNIAAAYVCFASLVECDPSSNCPDGTMTGIDEHGEVDETNTDACYPMPGAAEVIYCNDPITELAEMRIRMREGSLLL